MQTKLEVLICTYGREGIGRVGRMQLPTVDGVRYLVSWQPAGCDTSVIPSELRRDDVTVVIADSIGSSNNRNNAVDHATAPVCLMADDDLRYTPDGLLAVIDTFENNPDLDVASFRYSGDDNKQYPSAETDLTNDWPKNFYCASFEIAFRREAVAGRIFYNPYFGINAPRLMNGEDSVFILDCRNAGLNCRFFPITITHHAGLTTGLRNIDDPRVAMGEGAYIRYCYGWKGFPRVPLFVWRRFRSGKIKFLWGLLYVTKGFLYKVPKNAKTISN